MKKLLTIFILIIIGLYGCATKQLGISQEEFIVDITPIEPIIIYDTNDLDDAIKKVTEMKLEPIGKINLLDIPVFNRQRKMRFLPLDRAYAIGFPHKVGGSWRTWSYNSPTGASKAALRGCLNFVKDREPHLGEKAGAQLILVNNNLLVHPDTLPKSFHVPYILKRFNKSGETTILHGMFQHAGPGGNLKLKLFDSNGSLVGEGTYSLTILQAALDSGSFKMMYYPEQIEIKGTFLTEKIKLKHEAGAYRISIGKGHLPDGSKVNFFTGISIEHLKYYEYLLE